MEKKKKKKKEVRQLELHTFPYSPVLYSNFSLIFGKIIS